MAQFNRDSPSLCPRCEREASFEYHLNPVGGLSRCRSIPGSRPGKPHMHRKCNACGYQWAEVPGPLAGS